MCVYHKQGIVLLVRAVKARAADSNAPQWLRDEVGAFARPFVTLAC